CSLFSSKRSKPIPKASLFLTISTFAVLKVGMLISAGITASTPYVNENGVSFDHDTISPGRPNMHTILSHMNFLTWAPIMVATGLTSIHLVKEDPFRKIFIDRSHPVIPAEINMPTLRTTKVDMVKNNEALWIGLDLLEEKIEQAAI
nr:hypothetical protein [Tanacetum cinerariifolium]